MQFLCIIMHINLFKYLFTAQVWFGPCRRRMPILVSLIRDCLEVIYWNLKLLLLSESNNDSELYCHCLFPEFAFTSPGLFDET